MSEVPLYTLKRGDRRAACRRAAIQSPRLQGQLAHKKTHPPRTLPKAYAQGPRVVLGGWAFSYVRGTPVEGRIPAGDSFSKPNAQVSPCLAGVFDNFPPLSLTDAHSATTPGSSLSRPQASHSILKPRASSLEPRNSMPTTLGSDATRSAFRYRVNMAHTPFMPRFWPCFSGKSPWTLSIGPLFTGTRKLNNWNL